jgi:hypothetical protein
MLKRFVVLLVIGLSLNAYAAPAFDIPIKIFKALEIGDVKNLTEYFSESIELIILDNENIYSKSQASQILDDFFAKHPVTGFEVLHQGGPESAKYAIGKLSTKKGNFRVHFLVKMKNDKILIHQLRIQSE